MVGYLQSAVPSVQATAGKTRSSRLFLCLSVCFSAWLAAWLATWLADYLAGWLTTWLATWLTTWLTTWLATWLTGYLPACLPTCLPICLPLTYCTIAIFRYLGSTSTLLRMPLNWTPMSPRCMVKESLIAAMNAKKDRLEKKR